MNGVSPHARAWASGPNVPCREPLALARPRIEMFGVRGPEQEHHKIRAENHRPQTTASYLPHSVTVFSLICFGVTHFLKNPTCFREVLAACWHRRVAKICAFARNGRTISPTMRISRTANNALLRGMVDGPPTETHIYNARAMRMSVSGVS